MIEVTTYGFVGLIAMLVIAFYFAYSDDFSPARKKSSFDLIDHARSKTSQMSVTRKRNPPIRGAAGKQRKAAPASLQTISPVETGPVPINRDRVQRDGQQEASRG